MLLLSLGLLSVIRGYNDGKEYERIDIVWYAPFFSGGGYCSEAWDFAEGLELLANDAASSSGSSPLSFSAVQFAEPAECTVYIWSTSGEEDFHGESHGTRNVDAAKVLFVTTRPIQPRNTSNSLP